MSGEILVFVTCPSAAADEVARPLVEEGLAACVNVVSGVRSVFSWKGAIEVASEDLLVMKILAGRPQDELDIRGIVGAQRDHLDWDYCLNIGRELGDALGIDLATTIRALRD